MRGSDPAFSDFLETLRSRIGVSDIAGSRIQLKRAGREFKACCPFHAEKTASFTINDTKGFYHCFGCGAHGNVIDFLMRHDNLSFMEAVEQLAYKAGLSVPRPSAEGRQRAEKGQSLRACIEAATHIFETHLWGNSGTHALAQLENRGLDEKTIRSFRLGYAPANRQSLQNMLEELGISVELMAEVGLIKMYEGGRSSAFFADRLMFPVQDRQGRPVAFGGRLLRGDGPKYINSPDTSLFHKGELLYGFSRARQAVGQGDDLIVVEGYMDVIALVQHGWSGAVAPLGTALTPTQAELLWHMSADKAPILCFDGDVSGQRAAARALERVLPIAGADHRSMRFAFMPEDEDPDSLIRSSNGGHARMQAILDAAISMDQMLWTVEFGASPPQTPEAQAGLKKRLDARVGEIKDPDLSRAYKSALLGRFYDFVRSTRTKGHWGRTRQSSRASGENATILGTLRALPDAQEQQIAILIGLILLHPALLDDVSEKLGNLDIGNAEFRDVLDATFVWYENADTLDKVGLSAHLEAVGLKDALARLSKTCAAQTRCQNWHIDQARNAWQIWHRQLGIRLIEEELRNAEAKHWCSSGSQVDGLRSNSFEAGANAPHQTRETEQDRVWALRAELERLRSEDTALGALLDDKTNG